MDIEQLKASVKSVRAHLTKTKEVDHELKSLLQVLNSDILQLLEKKEDDLYETTTYGLAERAQELTAQFAAKHPQIEPALRELTNILANLGI